MAIHIIWAIVVVMIALIILFGCWLAIHYDYKGLESNRKYSSLKEEYEILSVEYDRLVSQIQEENQP